MRSDLRFGARLAGIIVLTLGCVLLHLMWRAVVAPSPWPRRFLGWTGRLAGMQVSVEGTPLCDNVFIVANHLSWLDIFVLAGVTGCAFVARDDLRHSRVIGWLAAQNNTILVERSARGTVAVQVAAIRAAMAGTQPVALFPEGTTGDGRALLPFKPSLLAVLLPPQPGLRVQPVLVDYGATQAEIVWTGDEGGLANVRRVLGRKGRTRVTLHFLDPIDPADMPDRKALSAELHCRLSGRLEALRGQPAAV